MLNRRNFVIAGSAATLCAPAIVRSHVLMTIRGVILPTEYPSYGFVDRLYINLFANRIRTLRSSGLPDEGVAAAINLQSPAVAGVWDAARVGRLLDPERAIAEADAWLRLRP